MEKSKYLRNASYLAVFISIILVASKFVAWNLSSSVSLKASLVDSILDAFASLINFFAIKQSLKPADKYHRFGHGKAEALAGLGQSAFIAGSALWILFEAIEKFITPKPILNSNIGSFVMILSIVLTLVLISYQKFVIKKTNSLAIAADSTHYKGDLLANVGVLVSLNISSFYDFPRLDAIIGAIIAFYITKSSWEIFNKSLDVLMDRELDDHDRKKIEKIISKSHEKVSGFHDLRTRSSGLNIFIQCHLELPPELSLKEAHEIAHIVSDKISVEYPSADIIIHQDPYDDSTSCYIK